jgi:spermidine/putrescine transport system substrate-binding protein
LEEEWSNVHPKESGINRRQLLRRSAVTAVGLSAAGALAGCENTTTPIGAADAAGDVSSAAAKLVVAKPLGPAGLPLPRPDNSVTWAITDDNKPIADGVKPEAGPLRIYNYADYVDPATVKKFQQKFGTKVQVATYNSSDEAIAKVASGAVSFDLIMGLSGSNVVDLIARKLIKPLNHSYLPNLEKNIWPELADPFYDRGAHYTVP